MKSLTELNWSVVGQELGALAKVGVLKHKIGISFKVIKTEKASYWQKESACSLQNNNNPPREGNRKEVYRLGKSLKLIVSNFCHQLV